jgi:phenylacetate-CoA ligase
MVRPRRRGVRQDLPLPLLVETSHAELACPIRAEIRAALAVTTGVKPVPPGSLPRSEYKSKLVDYSDAEGE